MARKRDFNHGATASHLTARGRLNAKTITEKVINNLDETIDEAVRDALQGVSLSDDELDGVCCDISAGINKALRKVGVEVVS